MNWLNQAQNSAAQHPTVTGLRHRAAWHREQSQNFLVHSLHAMRQHEMDAERAEATAKFVEMELVVRAGRDAGEWIAYAVGHSREVGKYIQVETRQGWDPDYFWCENPKQVEAESAALM